MYLDAYTHHRLDGILGSIDLSYMATTEPCVAQYPCILWALYGVWLVVLALVLK
jgi:hypothetical protein